MPMTPKEMVKLLQKNGSHQKMYNPKTNLTTSVPMHNKDLGVGLEHKILKQAGLKQAFPTFPNLLKYKNEKGY